jgi:branched-chain amino acid transport system substrate-binding protein
MRRFRAAVAACTLLTLGFAVWGLTASASTTADPIVIGAAIGKTGIISPLDTPMLVAAQLAADEANASGGINGRKLKIVSLDTKSDPAQGKALAQSLIGKGAKALLVSADYDLGSPAALEAQSKGIVTFSLGAQSPKFGVQGIGSLAYTAANMSYSEGAVNATFAKQQGYKKPFLLIETDNSYTQEVCSGFKQVWSQLGGSSDLPSATFTDADSASVPAQISAIKAASPDHVVVCGHPGGVFSVLRQIRAAGISVPIIADNATDGVYWIKAVPDITNLFVPSQISVFGDDPDPKVNRFVAAFKKRTGQPPPAGFVASGYSAMQALVMAMRSAKSIDGKAVAAALDRFKAVKLLVGPTTYTSSAHVPSGRPTRIIRYTNGKPAFFKLVTPKGKVSPSLK